jgi:hypothetical protein
MRNIVSAGIATLIVFGAADARAGGPGGILSPGASPYAILEPQTLNNGAEAWGQPSEPTPPPAPAKPRRHRQR